MHMNIIEQFRVLNSNNEFALDDFLNICFTYITQVFALFN